MSPLSTRETFAKGGLIRQYTVGGEMTRAEIAETILRNPPSVPTTLREYAMDIPWGPDASHLLDQSEEILESCTGDYLDSKFMVHCRACGITYDGNAQCCGELDHEVIYPIMRQYAFTGPLTSIDIDRYIRDLGLPSDLNITLSKYLQGVPWNSRSAALSHQYDIMDQSILSLLI
jgi:hypothetical protein